MVCDQINRAGWGLAERSAARGLTGSAALAAYLNQSLQRIFNALRALKTR